MALATEFDTAWLFPRKTAAFLNLWYRTYEEAKDALQQYPDRFLFPYRSQFVVCESSMLEHLGIDTNDPDWARIGHDWWQSGDAEARERLAAVLKGKLSPPETDSSERRLCSHY